MQDLEARHETGYQEVVPLLPTTSTNGQNETSSETSTEAVSHHNTKGNSKGTHKGKGYTLFVAVCFSLNYSIGSGILGLPYEYFKSGFFLGSVLLGYLGLLTYITYTYVMDGMQRAEALTFLAKQRGVTRTELLYDPQYTRDRLRGTSVRALQSHYSFARNEYQLSELIGTPRWPSRR